MHNPSQPFPAERGDITELTPRDIVRFNSLSLRWAGKGARVIAHGVATALDAALHPALVFVALDEPSSGGTITAIDGRLRAELNLSVEQWRTLFAPFMHPHASRVQTVLHPSRPGKLKLRVAPIGIECPGGYIVLASDDATFPQERDELLLEAASQQVALVAPASPVLRETEERYRRLLGLLPAAVYMCDAEGCITYYNRRAAALWGREPALNDTDERFCGSFRLWHPDGRPLPRAETPMARALTHGESARNQEVVIERPDGSRVTVSVNIDPLHADDGTRIGAINTFQDVTDRKQVEEDRARALDAERETRAEAELMRDLGNDLNSDLHLEALLQRMTDAATSAVGAQFGAFFYKATDAKDGRYALYTLSGAPREAFAQYPMPRSTALFGLTFRGEAPVRCDDVTKDPRYGQNAPYHGMPPGHLPVRSYLAVPVRSRSGEVFGGLFFGHGEPGRFEERHERIVVGIAAQAAVAVDNARLFEAVREQAERLRIAYDQAPLGIAHIDLEGRFISVNDRYCYIVGNAREDLIGQVFNDVATKRCDDPAAAGADLDCFRRLIAGEIDVYEREQCYAHKDGRMIWARLSVAMARNVAGAPSYAIGVLEDITARRTVKERERFLAEASKQLAASLDYRETLADIARLAVPAIADWCAVDILDPQGQLVQLAITHTDPGKLEDARELRRRYPPDPDAARGPYRVLRTGQAELVSDITDAMLERAARDAEHLARLRAFGLRSYVCMPLAARGRTLGTLTLVYADSGRRFEESDRGFVEEIARRAAIAIDNALLFDASRDQANRLQVTYDNAPIGIAETAFDGGFLRVNDKFCVITGYAAEELRGLKFADITHPDDIAISESPFRELVGGEIDSYCLEKRYRRKSGGVVWVRVTMTLARDDAGRPEYAIGAIEDITERRRAEIVLTGQKRALEQMARREPLKAVLETLVDTFNRQSTAQGKGMVLLLAPGGDYLCPVASGKLPSEWVNAIQKVQVGENMALCGRAVYHGQPVFVPDIATDPYWESYRESAMGFGFRAAWSFCLRSSSHQVVGTFPVLYNDPRAPTEDELRFVPLLTDTAALAIERYRDEQSLQDQAEVLRQIHDAVVVVDIGGVVQQWNEGAARLFGYGSDEAIGRHVSLLCAAPEDYSWIEQNVLVPLKRDGRLERVASLRRRSGELLHAHMSMSLLRDERGEPRAMVAYMLDVTPRVNAERELALRLRQQEALARFGQAALSGTDVQELMEQVVALVADTLNVPLCKVLELQADGQSLQLRAGVGWRDGLVGRADVSAGLESQAGLALMAKEPVVVANLQAETRFSGSPLLQEHGVVSGMSVVIQGAAERPYGVLGAHTTAARHFSPHDVNFLQSVAHVLAGGIQRKRFEEAMRRAHDELEQRVEERTAELAQANQSLRDEVVDRMGVETALRESEAQYRMLFERNPVPAWVFDIHTRQILAANETAVWLYGYTREEFLHMNIHDLHPPEDASRALDYAEQFPPETAYIGTWRHRKQDETVIDVEMFVYEVLFQGRWARLMLANDITERKRAEEEFHLLETITRAVSEARDLDAALYAVLRHICEATGWVLGEAWLPAPNNEYLRCSRAWYYGAEGLEEFRHAAWDLKLRRGEGLIGRAWGAGQAVWLPDVTEGDTFRRAREARAAGLRAGIAFPVIAEGEAVALFAFFLREPRIEDEHQVKLVTTIAAQAGLAIQRKRAEERLRESEERFRLLVEGAHDYAIFMLDSDGCIASWNRGAEQLTGYAAEEAVGRSMEMFYSAEDIAREAPSRALAQARADGVYEGEGWRLRKDGERFWASVTLTTLRDASGNVLGFVKVTRDVTERRQAEERLSESEARLVRAQEFSLLMVAHVGLDGRWLKVPQMLCATLAYREEELLAGRIQDVTHPDDHAAEQEQCDRLVRGEAKSFDLEKRYSRRDGKVVWAYQNTSIVLDAEDRPLHFLTFIRDITQRKEAEEQLRRSELQLSEAQRLAHLGSWEWDVTTGRVEWSEELYRIYGVVPETPVTFESYLARVHPDDRERVSRTVSTALESQQPFTVEERIARPDGELRHLLSHGAVVIGPRGEVARMVGVCLDITERKRAEERLREYAHRLESLSQRLLEAQETERRRIARELHDQIGQDLSVIKINLQAVQRLPGAAAVGSHLQETVRIVENVLVTARNLSVELRPSMLDDLGLAAALRWYLDRQVQRTGIALHFAVDSFDVRLSPTIETACFRLAQEALTNILRHAQARRVSVTLRTTARELEMRIVDDGQGFDVDAARLRAARGESFGLLGMEERALLAGGRLEVTSAPGRGASVIACFPLTLTLAQTHE